MINEKENEDLLKNVPEELIHFFRNYFIGEKTDPETMARAELLAKTLMRFMLQLYIFGIEGEYQPVFIATNYVKPHTGGVTEFERTYEMIGGEPADTFKLGFMADEYEKAYKAWVKEIFGVELSEDAAEFFQQWGGVLK